MVVGKSANYLVKVKSLMSHLRSYTKTRSKPLNIEKNILKNFLKETQADIHGLKVKGWKKISHAK